MSKINVIGAGGCLTELIDNSAKYNYPKDLKTLSITYKPNFNKKINTVELNGKNLTGEFPRAMTYFEKIKHSISYENYLSGMKNLVNHIVNDVFKMKK